MADCLFEIINYQQATELIPVFKHIARYSPSKSVIARANRILRELSNVRPTEYCAKGYQCAMAGGDIRLLRRAIRNGNKLQEVRMIWGPKEVKDDHT